MTTLEAKVIQDIPAYRLVALGGVNSEGNLEEGWETIYLKTSELGWIPDMVTSDELKKDSFVSVAIKDNPVWKVEASQNLPAGTLVMCDDDGRVKSYTPTQGNHIGYTTHAVEEGEVVKIVRKYGQMPQTQVEAAAFKAEDFQKGTESNKLVDLTNAELKELLDEKGIEYKANATKPELIALLGGE